MFELDKGFEIMPYTFFRQRHVARVPGIYFVICNDKAVCSNRFAYIGQAKNLRRRYVEHYNERSNERLRQIIENCQRLVFAWLPVYEDVNLTVLEQEYITRYKDIIINIQFA